MISESSIRLPEEDRRVNEIMESIHDPEVPVLSILDLGIVRKWEFMKPATGPGAQPGIRVYITPTYSGCPAMDTIRMQLRMALAEAGFAPVVIESVLSPAWTTEWMSEKGKQQLKSFGIAPPNPRPQVCDLRLFPEAEAVQCPRCNSWHTQMISQFGSTACKALYRCLDCEEPFDYFKCH